MRKTAKILAVLLTLCLLCGIMVSVVASATEVTTVTPYESLSVSGSDKNVNWDFNDGTTVGNWTLNSNAVDSSKIQFGSVGDNKYFILGKNIDATNSGYYAALNVGTDISGAQYVTVDYDLATDKYVYVYDSDKNGTYDKASWEALDDYVAIPVYALNTAALEQLSTRTSINTGTQYRLFDFYAALDNNGEAKFTTQRIGWEPDTGRHFLYSQSPDTGYDTKTKVYLPNEINEFTHITKVYEIVNGDNGYTVTEYTYVNGVCYWSYSTSFTSIESLKTGKLNFKLRNSTSRFISLAIDNVAVNVYNTNIYDEGNTFETPIYNNSSVLYNERYDFSPNESLVIKDKDGNVKLTTDVVASDLIARYTATGDTITTSCDLQNFAPTGVDSFTVVLNNGATFSLADGAGFQDPVISGNSYTYSKAAINVDGTNYTDFALGAQNIKTGSEVTTSYDFTGVSVPAGVRIFTVICENDAIFSLAEGSPYQAIVNEEADKTVYTVSYRKLNVSENSSNIYWNFEDGVNPWGTFASGSETTIKTLNGNKYATYGIIEGDAGTGSRTNTRLTINKTLASDVQYVTFDYDFGTDKYLVDTDDDGKFDTYSDTPVEGCIPAYGYSPNETGMCDDYFFFMQFCDASSTANTYNFKKMYIGFEEETKQYFLHFEGSDVKAYLSNEVGVFDHITNVYQFVSNPAGGYTISEYVYVNGVHCFTNDLSVTGEVRVYRIMASSFGAAVANRYYAYAFDNIALNCYTDDIFGAEYDFTAPIYNNSNVLYNKDTYVTPNYDRYMTVDEDMTWIINAGLDAIEENSNVTVSEAKVNTNLSVNSINLSLINGAKFNVQNVAYSFVPAGENSFTVTKGDLAQAYMDLAGDMTFNLIVNAGGTIASVDGEYIAYFDGNKIFWTPAIENYDSNRITIYYDANKTVSTTITLDVVKYAENVSEYYGCGSEEAKLVYEIMAYKEAVVEYVINGNLHSTTLNDYMTAHKECGCNVTNSLSSDDAGYVIPEELSGIGISYAPSLGKIGIIIEGVAEGTDITVSYSYIYEGDTVTEPFSVEYVTEGEGYYIVEGSAAYLSQTLDFNIGGTEFKYSIQQYFHNITEASGEEGLPYYTEELVLKMYEYSVAAFNYKFDFEGEDAVPAE